MSLYRFDIVAFDANGEEMCTRFADTMEEAMKQYREQFDLGAVHVAVYDIYRNLGFKTDGPK